MFYGFLYPVVLTDSINLWVFFKFILLSLFVDFYLFLVPFQHKRKSTFVFDTSVHLDTKLPVSARSGGGRRKISDPHPHPNMHGGAGSEHVLPSLFLQGNECIIV